jgi:hypothetical protein
MRGLFPWAEEAEYLKDNPTRGVKIGRKATEGFHVWTADECKQFEARWPLGTRERLAYDLFFTRDSGAVMRSASVAHTSKMMLRQFELKRPERWSAFGSRPRSKTPSSLAST